ncbi:MAG: PAS domain-containing protein [Chloroflexi bacterium]|nr:PAS domain-containing protein [Chloroflexota bacterium]
MVKMTQLPPPAIPWSDLVTHDGLFSVDARQRIVHWSDSAQRILGMRGEDVVGKFCYDVVGGRDDRNYRFCRRNCPVLLNARRGRATPNYDILCQPPEGDDRWLNISVVIPRRNRGSFQVLHLFRDVTSRRHTEAFAQRAGAALRELLAEETAAVQGEAPATASALSPRLSRREQEVLRLLASGQSTKEIAGTLGVQPITARNHITRVLNKLGAENRLKAVVYASQHGLL